MQLKIKINSEHSYLELEIKRLRYGFTNTKFLHLNYCEMNESIYLSPAIVAIVCGSTFNPIHGHFDHPFPILSRPFKLVQIQF